MKNGLVYLCSVNFFLLHLCNFFSVKIVLPLMPMTESVLNAKITRYLVSSLSDISASKTTHQPQYRLLTPLPFPDSSQRRDPAAAEDRGRRNRSSPSSRSSRSSRAAGAGAGSPPEPPAAEGPPRLPPPTAAAWPGMQAVTQMYSAYNKGEAESDGMSMSRWVFYLVAI